MLTLSTRGNPTLQITDRFFDNTDFIAGGDCAAFNYFAEDAFFRHDAFAHFLEDSAADMTFLANLGYFQHDFFPHFDFRADGDRNKVDSLRSQILGKSAGAEVQAEFTHFINAFRRQQADLAVSVKIGVGIGDHPETFLEPAGRNNVFTGAFFITAADCDYFSSIFHIVLLELAEMMTLINISLLIMMELN